MWSENLSGDSKISHGDIVQKTQKLFSLQVGSNPITAEHFCISYQVTDVVFLYHLKGRWDLLPVFMILFLQCLGFALG